MEPLPFVDEHAVPIDEPRDVIWASIVRTLSRTLRGSTTFARVLGCDPVDASKGFEGRVGQTLPGFRVVDAEPGHHLALEGSHRFSRYRLTFELDDRELRARTDAAFPGVGGRLYRAAVIGSGAHERITRRMLRQMGRPTRA